MIQLPNKNTIGSHTRCFLFSLQLVPGLDATTGSDSLGATGAGDIVEGAIGDGGEQGGEAPGPARSRRRYSKYVSQLSARPPQVG
jgi:hypothetical protein